MKKIIIALIVFFGFSLTANAATANISISSTYSQLVVGNSTTIKVTISSSAALGSWEYTLNWDSSIYSLTSTSPSRTIAEAADNGTTKSVTYSYTFKSLKSGTGTFSVSNIDIYGWDEQRMTINAGTRSVKSITRAELEASYSKNNDLKSLEVTGFELNEEFDSEVTEYSVTVPSDTETVEILGVKDNTYASVSGTGTHEVTYGLNVFEIIVTAQNGSVKKYIVNVTVEELEPIEVVVDKKTLTVVRNEEAIIPPSTFTQKTIIIDDKEVPALYYDLLKITLVGLKDESGNIELYEYDSDKNTYQLYKEINFSNFAIIPKETNKEIAGYTYEEITINDTKLMGFKKSGSDYFIFYGTNTLTGKDNLYKYDKVENTIQRYDEDVVDEVIVKNYMIAIYAFGACLLIAIIIIAIQANQKNKTKKRIKEYNHKISEKKTPSLDDVYNILEKDKKKSKK